MKPTSHIVNLLLSTLLLLCGTSVTAQDAQMGGLHCGDVVVITATPENGSRFVQWSDGNTDNPREIEIGEDGNIDVYAIFEDVCAPQTVIQLVDLYGQLMMVNVEDLHQQGYQPQEQDVFWYRIVGEQDIISHPDDDILVHQGYYVNRQNLSSGDYYAQIIPPSPPANTENDCPLVLRSETFAVYHTGKEDIIATEEQVRKFIYNEHLYIQRQDHCYDALGQPVR